MAEILQVDEKKKRERRAHFINLHGPMSPTDKLLYQQELKRIKEGRRKEREEMKNG